MNSKSNSFGTVLFHAPEVSLSDTQTQTQSPFGMKAGRIVVKAASQFVINAHPPGWRCTECGGVLRVPIMDSASAAEDPVIQTAFAAHICEARGKTASDDRSE